MTEFFANARQFTMEDFKKVGRPNVTVEEFLFDYPPTLKWTSIKTFRVSGINFSILQEKIQKFFVGFEQLKIVEWVPTLSLWKIEYATRPLEFRSDFDYKQVWCIKKAAWMAAGKAAKTHIPINEEEEFHYGIEVRRWHHSELRIYSDPENKGDIILDFVKMRGDGTSFWYIFEALKKYLSKDNIRFWMREQFLALIDGIQIDYENHVLRYLLNELIVCDICTYLDSPAKIRPAF